MEGGDRRKKGIKNKGKLGRGTCKSSMNETAGLFGLALAF